MRKTASLPQTPNKNGCQKTKNQKKKRGKENGKNKKITVLLQSFPKNLF